MAKKRRVPEKLRQQVRERANGCCEYCLVHEQDMFFPFQADHIIAEQHRGATELDNLAWTCGIFDTPPLRKQGIHGSLSLVPQGLPAGPARPV